MNLLNYFKNTSNAECRHLDVVDEVHGDLPHAAQETVAQVATWDMEEKEISSSGLVTPSKLVRKLCLS